MHLLLVDGSGYIFRAFHALPQFTRSDKLPVGCVLGFCNMIFKLEQDLQGDDAPTHMAVVFDYSGRTFRDQIYADYKAHRPPPPEEMVPQFPLTRTATAAYGLPSIEMEDWEADDIIATYACMARDAGGKVTIVSSDKDLMQLVEPDGSIRLLDTIPRPGQPPLRWIGMDEVFDKFGVTPDKVIDVQALCGDSVDNVPGVPGIGVKTAAELINAYGDVETLLARADEIRQPKRRQTLLDNKDLALISKRLVTLSRDVPVQLPLDALAREPIDPGKLFPFLKAMEFTKAIAYQSKVLEVNPDDWPADPDLAAVKIEPIGFNNEAKEAARVLRLAAEGKAENAAVKFAAERLARVKTLPIDAAGYETITDAETLGRWLADIEAQGYVAIDLESTGLDNQTADLVGIALALAPGKAAYLPLGHTSGSGMFGERLDGQLDLRQALDLLRPMLEARSILKIGHNVKYDLGLLLRYGIDMRPFDDTLLMSYVLDGVQYNTLSELSAHWFGHKGTEITELIGKGKNQKTFAEVPIADAARYAAEDTDLTIRLWMILKPRLAAENMTTLYETEERPLAPVLARMEGRGISVDRNILSRLTGDFTQRAAALEELAYEMAGERFNIGSPKQLGDILFGKMGLPGGSRTKTGQWSTTAGALEDLAEKEGVPLAKVIVDWRQLTKLIGTYTAALPDYINARTNRVHTTYSQHSVLTGRLSSNDPNLQNIPVRTEDGRKIRTAFVAAPGKMLVSADYSQIELRILAHIADIQALKDAFEEGLDIHAMTASEMFGVPVEGMPAEVRRRAKAINFGIIYGISAFGLANQLGIGQPEARDYIAKYFQRYPGIRDYMEVTKEYARKHGYVLTPFGRKVHLRFIHDKSQGMRAFAERAAINAPLQGGAADIIKRAMIRLPAALTAAKLKAQMLLQVHDELLFEVPDKEIDKTKDVTRKVMESAASLTVPLVVETGVGDNWAAAH